MSLFHFCHYADYGFRGFISSFSYSYWLIFTAFGEITDANKVMNAEHFGRDRPNFFFLFLVPKMRILTGFGHFRFRTKFFLVVFRVFRRKHRQSAGNLAATIKAHQMGHVCNCHCHRRWLVSLLH